MSVWIMTIQLIHLNGGQCIDNILRKQETLILSICKLKIDGIEFNLIFF